MTSLNSFKNLTLLIMACVICSCTSKFVQPADYSNLMSSDGQCRPPVTSYSQLIERVVLTVYLDKVSEGTIDPYKDKLALESYAKTDEATQAYLLCNAISKGIVTTPEDIAYLKSNFAILKTNPTPDEYIEWLRQHPKLGEKGLRISASELRVSTSNPRSDLIVFNTGDTPLVIMLELPDIFYSPYRKTYLAPHDKVFMTIILTRHSIDSTAPSGEYAATLTSEGLPSVPFKIIVTP